ncbi:MAG: PhzF family phenazine biosynthesis protein [Anaerolineae bacterium]|nr:PhzF family phenazine biosynthesis protein [Anaerolineae bacterium]
MNVPAPVTAYSGSLYRLAAFTDENSDPSGADPHTGGNPPSGGNPAGVWIGAALPEVNVMQQIAAEVGYSETAFLCPSGERAYTIRYYSPEIEVPFCGHATIATGILLGQLNGPADYSLHSSVGLISLNVSVPDGRVKAALTSVEPAFEPASAGLVQAALACLRWPAADLDRSIAPARAFAGAWHLVLAVSSFERLAALDYDFEALKELMFKNNLTTLQLIWRESETLFHARNPFPVGGVVEDPATGAAAAALGGYLRLAGLVQTPFAFTILQGESMGRPSRLSVNVPVSGGIVVAGGGRFLA